jgi:L-glutamine-phosphate cytidylyltransferase
MAGVSSRLLPLTERIHKSLLDVAGRPLIEWQLAAMEEAGIDEVVLVVGHAAEAIRNFAARRVSKIRITFVENQEYRTLNLDYSVYLALRETGLKPFVYIEGDLLLAPDLVRRVAGSTSENAIAVDASIPSGRPDALVTGSIGRATGIVFSEHGNLRSHAGPDVLGELICLGRFSAGSARLIRDALHETAFTGPMQLYKVFERIFARCDTECVFAAGQPWYEIDSLEDLEAARLMARTVAPWASRP